ncbi:MAG: tyrosine-type recombinase/integrase [Kofleriaceae bacterium]|nr:tyrosine-type recombinase/integrase [Kofleriaceae bacterium]
MSRGEERGLLPGTEELAPRMVADKMAELGVPKVSGDATLFSWFVLYMQLEVIGIKAKATEEAKWQDMRAFLRWYAEANKHLAVEMWLKRDTAGFLDVLEAKGRKPATINRAFHTLRTFSRWLRMRPDNPLRDNPVHTSMERIQPQREPSKLAAPVMWSLLKAADNLVLTEAKNKNSRPVRNRAILVVLQETGLRVSELCDLSLGQYEGKYFRNVKRKGRRFDDVYVPKKARGPLNEYIEGERKKDTKKPDGSIATVKGGKSSGGDECLFLSGRVNKRGTRRMHRDSVANVLEKIAAEAGKYSDEGIEVHPHMLRHTYGSKVMAKTSSESQTATFLGHSSTKYTGMYIGLTRQEREDLLDED